MVTAGSAEVFENGYVLITPAVLDAHDPDTQEEMLTFSVERTPQHGELSIQGEKTPIK